MHKYQKVVIVVALVIVVGMVFALKQNHEASSDPRDEPGQTVHSPADQGAASSAKTHLPRLVDLGAGKCIPCKLMAPILEELKKEYAGRMEVEFIDVWENRLAGERYRIRSIPTQIFYDASGKELFRHEGFYSKQDILNKCKELGFNLDKERTNE